VPLVASGAFGSISGLAVANIYATGQVTIPLMKKHGVAGHVAGAIEAVASTGGLILPPVMGIVAFIMATFLGMSYASICIAAALPAILYYIAAYIQIDRYAVKQGFASLKAEQIPTLKTVLRKGWIFIVPLAVLIYTMFIMALEAEACALYSAGIFLLIAMFRKHERLRWGSFLDILEQTGRAIVEIGIVCAVAGFLIGAIMFTGLGFSAAQVVFALCGDNLFMVLILAAIMCIIMGMGMPIVTVYVIVALVIAPILSQFGSIPEISTHMFVYYFGMVSFLTPPIMLSVYAASNISHANPWKTAWRSLRMSIAAYVVPFVFIFDPALLMHGTFKQIVVSGGSAILGISMIALGLEGYILRNSPWYQRILVIAGGLALLIPAPTAKWVGFICALVIGLWEWLRARRRGRRYPARTSAVQP
jgi:TRAP transporter 4TM/12TM fusion protein